MTLHNRVCLVVGGVSAIGKEIAKSLSESGATVIVTTSRSLPAVASTPTVSLDVREPETIRAALDQVAANYGRLDVMVYNSGLTGPFKPLDAISDDEWEDVFAVNVTGLFRMCRASLPLLRLSPDGGRIIAISSMTGRRPLLHRSPYAATKMALTGFVRSLALEVGHDGVTVNTVSPGYVKGERLDRMIRSQADERGITFDEMRAQLVLQSPVGTLVAPSSIARTVGFLADSASADITGTDINVTAGVWMGLGCGQTQPW